MEKKIAFLLRNNNLINGGMRQRSISIRIIFFYNAWTKNMKMKNFWNAKTTKAISGILTQGWCYSVKQAEVRQNMEVSQTTLN